MSRRPDRGGVGADPEDGSAELDPEEPRAPWSGPPGAESAATGDPPGDRPPPGDADTLRADEPSDSGARSLDDGGARGLFTPPKEDPDALERRLAKQRLFPRRAAPVKIGRFAVLHLIGKGGMGVVYACYDDQLDRKVAVKLLLNQQLRDPQVGRARLQREALAMARLSHPNIVTVLEVGAMDEEVYLAMEFVRGESLDAWSEAARRSWREVVDACVQAGRGLAAAHRAGIIHRDFKPQNVLITPDGVVKVLDFGLARTGDEPADPEPPTSPPASRSQSALGPDLTRTGALLGTPAYMSPEQHGGERASAASDQFSFCVSMYQLLYGALPFASDSLDQLRYAVLTGQVAAPPPRSGVPERLYRALRRGMAVDPRERFPAMDDLLAELTHDRRAIYRRTLATAVAAGVLGIAGSLTAGAWTRPEEQTCPDARAQLASAWDPGRAAAVQAAFMATGLPRAAEAWAVAQPRLERRASAWARMHGEACQAHAEGRQSHALFELRSACLDQQRAGLAELVDVLASVNAATLDAAVAAVANMPALEPCADSGALTAAPAPPTQPWARARVQGLRESLARALVQEAAGRSGGGLARVTQIHAEAVALGHEPLVAEALLRRGSLQVEAGQPAQASDTLRQALLSALRADHKVVAAQAITRRLLVRAEQLGELERAVAELPLAAALNRHVEAYPDLYADYLDTVGAVQLRAQRPGEARVSFERSLALREQHGRGETLEAMETIDALARVAQLEGREQDRVALLRRLVALSGPALGEHHPYHLRAVAALADTRI